ncbi:MFS transporter [Leptospira sp. GIMC2001]|uniref:MFS transporter n=1 Tax=Leptospira sp. GIMC2001 TaxID=1513297 RepID=UPI002349701C|nr:MFS transporter [Leptospira sp. GIMC2001]WCL49219.1 MFS transporter [Leptospira sp. GIMC2001]
MEEQNLHDHKQERWIIVILAFMQFAHILDFVIMMPLGPFFMQEFKINSLQFGILVSVYTFSAGIFGLLGAFYLDRYDRKFAAIFVFSGFTFGTIFCAFAPDYNTLLVARAVAGGFGGIIGAVVLAIIGDIIPFFRRGKATGAVMSAFSIASVIGIPIGMILAENFGWHAPFLALGILSLAFIPLSYKILPTMRLHLEGIDSTKPAWNSISIVLSRKNSYLVFLFLTCLMFGGFTIIPFLTPYMVGNVGLQMNELKYIYLFGGLFTFFSMNIIGKLSDRFGKQKIFTFVAILSWAPVLFVTNMTTTPLALTLTVTTIFMVLVSGRIVPAFAIITSTVEPQLRGSFMSITSSVQQLASGLASFLAGTIIYEVGNHTLVNYNIVGYIAVIASMISVFLVWKLKTAH